MNEILLYSGGLDSYIAWHYLNKPRTVYFNLRHRYGAMELEAISKTIPDTLIDFSINLGDQEHEDSYIPLRNLYLAMGATKYGDRINLIVQKGEMDIKDRSVYFFREASQKLSFLLGKRIHIKSPFFEITKTEMVR